MDHKFRHSKESSRETGQAVRICFRMDVDMDDRRGRVFSAGKGRPARRDIRGANTKIGEGLAIPGRRKGYWQRYHDTNREKR